MTPDNPFSVPSSERANRFKRALLRLLLPDSRLATTAHDPTGRWPDEHSFLVMGWSMRSVKALGHTFGQNAVHRQPNRGTLGTKKASGLGWPAGQGGEALAYASIACRTYITHSEKATPLGAV